MKNHIKVLKINEKKNNKFLNHNNFIHQTYPDFVLLKLVGDYER